MSENHKKYQEKQVQEVFDFFKENIRELVPSEGFDEKTQYVWSNSPREQMMTLFQMAKERDAAVKEAQRWIKRNKELERRLGVIRKAANGDV